MRTANISKWIEEHFPKAGDREAIAAWKPFVTRRSLAMRVLVVAQTRIEGAWAAYCDAVPGINHNDEQEAVLRHGQKLHEHYARALFPDFEEIPYAD